MSQEIKGRTHVKQVASFTRNDHGQPVAFVTQYQYCDPGEEGAFPVSDIPENSYDGSGSPFDEYRHYLHEIVEDEGGRDYNTEARERGEQEFQDGM